MSHFIVNIVIGLATGSTAVILALLCFITFCFIVVYICYRKNHQLRIARHDYYTNPNVELQNFQGHNSLPTNTLPLLYDQYSEVSAPYSVIAYHTHKKRNRTLPPLPKPPTLYRNRPCTHQKNQNDASLSDACLLLDNTEDTYEHMDSFMTTNTSQLKSDLYETAV